MGKREALQTFGDRISLPSLPDIVMRVNAMIDDPTVGLSEIGKLAAQDPAITARVLRLANSGYYGLREQVTNAEQAATVIGSRALRNVAMQVSILARYDHLKGVQDFDIDQVWKHSVVSAQVAQRLAELSQRRVGLAPDDGYACGLLHDVGKVVLLEGLTDEYLDCVRTARSEGITLHKAEERIFGFTHLDVGAVLATQWQLPEKVAHAIEFHHGPTSAIAQYPHVGVVAIADQIAYRLCEGGLDRVTEQLAALSCRVLGVERAEFERVIEAARSAQGQSLA